MSATILQRIDGVLCTCYDNCRLDAADFEIDGTLSGTWYDPAHDGEGWIVEVLNPETALVIWFSYTPGGDQAWFLGTGAVDGDRITLDMEISAGTSFGAGFDTNEIEKPIWGMVTIEFNVCSSGTVSYESVIDGYGSGQLNAVRLTTLDGLKCEP
jgi:hypothetical protein